MGFTVRWPIYGNRLNTRQYRSTPELMGDMEAIWSTVLRDGLKVERKQYKDYSVILVVPDFYERTYMREMCNLILVTMGFKQLCVQQVSSPQHTCMSAAHVQTGIDMRDFRVWYFECVRD